jgi:hypothetical protein
MRNVAPVYDQLWQCTAGLIYTEAAHRNAYEMCIPQSAWPAIDVMQTPYSSTFLGSYNKHFVLVVGIWIMCSFAVYSFYLGEFKLSAGRFKPNFLMAGGLLLTTFCFFWCAGGVLMAVARSFTSADTAANFPMSVQTVIVTIFATSVSVIYYGRELWEIIRYARKSGDDTATASVNPSGQQSRYPHSAYSPLRTFMTPKDSEGDVTLSDLMPVVLPAWNDCFLICDGLIFLGLVGSAKDVVTADVVLCFLAVTGAAAMNSALSRIFVDTYNAGDNKGQRTEDDEETKYPLRVMALGCYIACFCFSLIYWYLIFSRYASYPVILAYVSMTSFFPLVFMGVILIFADFLEIGIEAPHHWIFLYQILMRSCFVFVVVAMIKNDVDVTYNNVDSLAKMIRLISVE